MNLHPMAAYEDQVINHANIVKEIQKKVGPYSQLGKLSTYNPKTKKYFAVSDNYVPDPVVWRQAISGTVSARLRTPGITSARRLRS